MVLFCFVRVLCEYLSASGVYSLLSRFIAFRMPVVLEVEVAAAQI